MTSKAMRHTQIIDDEVRSYQDESARVKFKQNLMQGIGGAMVFGIASAGGYALLNAIINTTLVGAMAVVPWIGVAALVTVGVGFLYKSSKFYAESTRIDQTYQAQQIAKGVKGVAPVIEHAPTSFPSQSTAAEHTEQPATQEARWTDRLALTPPEGATPVVARKDQSWAERAQAADATLSQGQQRT